MLAQPAVSTMQLAEKQLSDAWKAPMCGTHHVCQLACMDMQTHSALLVYVIGGGVRSPSYSSLSISSLVYSWGAPQTLYLWYQRRCDNMAKMLAAPSGLLSMIPHLRK